ncbi:hypothetical protein AQUCO_00900202v1 [Aquilegia coerulea]|uniref:Uncharacterized protein n=1 Tax=Aquilegia coerulea TaxID=218851 RepID=A0A2G5ECM1_AQUCA|nr:hypothetical protein AQUCO_00900202v1 [Aquilegia coerulea]
MLITWPFRCLLCNFRLIIWPRIWLSRRSLLCRCRNLVSYNKDTFLCQDITRVTLSPLYLLHVAYLFFVIFSF